MELTYYMEEKWIEKNKNSGTFIKIKVTLRFFHVLIRKSINLKL